MPTPAAPALDCALCTRLAQFRTANRETHGDWHNAPVPSFGPIDARLLIVGLAPGLKGANRTGRPFTGDYAGDLLYATLKKFGYAKGEYAQHAKDGFELVDCRITNSVRCVPPENKPTPAEIAACRPFLVDELAAMPKLETILALGAVAHQTVLTALGEKRAKFPFAHGAVHALSRLRLADSYHCSRYNTNTGRLTPQMFEGVFTAITRAA